MKTLLLLILLVTVGCHQSTPDRELLRRVANLERRSTELSAFAYLHSSTNPIASPPWFDFAYANIEEISNRLSQAEISISYLMSQPPRQAWVFPRIPSDGYVLAHTESLPLVIQVKDATPSLDGFKFTVLIGNPSSCTIDSAQMTARWGETGTLITICRQRIAPGTWQDTDIIVAPCTLDELRGLRLKFSDLVVSLRELRK